MYLFQKNSLVILISLLFIGCNSNDNTKKEPSPTIQKAPSSNSLKTEAIVVEPEVVQHSPSQTLLQFKVKPPFVDVHNQSGVKLGTSDSKGVFSYKVDSSGKDLTFYFKKEAYSKKTLQLNASGEMQISYLRLDPIIPAVKLAESGDPKAQLLVGDMYFEGSNGVDQSLSTANYFYSMSAQSGNLESKARLCAILQQDYSLGDANENLKYCKEAATQNNATALFFLGMLYKKDTVVDKNLSTAKEYFTKALKLGLEEAQEELDLLK
ncbi:MAG: sel1 repeat family protein [Candidatus Cloacimonetes bacterium]|nr:sel1 repeat family protein [Candidatus Cloacimonadota bacterium]